MSVGPHELVRDLGARLVVSSAQVIEECGAVGDALEPGDGVEETRSRIDELEPRAARILDAVPTSKALSVERIAASAGLSARDVRRTLPTLVLLGIVEERLNGFRLTESARSELGTRESAPTPALR
jgi:DNA processing protein